MPTANIKPPASAVLRTNRLQSLLIILKTSRGTPAAKVKVKVKVKVVPLAEPVTTPQTLSAGALEPEMQKADGKVADNPCAVLVVTVTVPLAKAIPLIATGMAVVAWVDGAAS